MKYTVKYKMYYSDTEHGIVVNAKSKYEAYTLADAVEIPNANGGDHAYSAWVESVEYKNGKVRYFNTCEGLAY